MRFNPRWITLMLFVVPALAAGGCGNGDGAADSRSVAPLAIIVSGDTGGWITPCGCASNQSGGLARRATYLATAADTHSIVYLDVGGAAAGVSDYHRQKFEAILRGEIAMGLSAHNLGKAELAFGVASLRDTQSRLDVPFISASVVDEKGMLHFDDLKSIEVNGRRLAVIGVVSRSLVPEGVRVLEPKQAVLAAMSRHADRIKGASVIVLAYLPEGELAELAGALPEVDAVIGGPTGQAMSPRRVGPVTLAAATNKGKFLIRLESPAPGKPWAGDAVEVGPALADNEKQLDNVKDFLSRLARTDYAAADTGIVAALPVGSPADYRIAGSAACADCHHLDQNVWHSSKHSHATDTLRDKGFAVDSFCQSCHTTGFALPGGFDRLSTGKAFFGVGCENCHGPSAAHVRDPNQRTPWRAADQCLRCHDHENSPAFDFAVYWQRVRHGKTPAATGRNS
ncbi:MAG: multiheme c-type cytochrome [Phycisphaeraceae bacterium]